MIPTRDMLFYHKPLVQENIRHLHTYRSRYSSFSDLTSEGKHWLEIRMTSWLTNFNFNECLAITIRRLCNMYLTCVCSMTAYVTVYMRITPETAWSHRKITNTVCLSVSTGCRQTTVSIVSVF